jgi:acetolactate synthase-1/2/3 large subunit
VKASQVAVDILVEAGIDTAFGIPGGAAGIFFNRIHERPDAIRFVLTRHEQSTSIMADVYGRLTGRPGVAVGQGVFMASSGAFGIMEAAASSSPMLVLTDTSDGGAFAQHAAYQSGTGEYGSFDLPATFRTIAKFVAYAVTGKEVVQGVQLGIKHSLAGRPGPSVVLCRADSLDEEVGAEDRPLLYPSPGYWRSTRTVADPALIEQAASILGSAERPVIVAGNGVHVGRAWKGLRALAERLGAPVATSAKGRSAIEDTHRLSVGLMGAFGRSEANRSVAEADVVLVAGCKLAPNTTRYENPELLDPRRQRIVQIDIDPRNSGWTYPVDIALAGDVDLDFAELLAALTKQGETNPREPWFTRDSATADPAPNDSGIVLRPQRIVDVLNDVLPTDAMITMDAGKNRLFTMHGFRAKQPGSMIVPGGIAGMGWATPAAVAAKIVNPTRPVVAIAGDGGFSMTIHALATAVQANAPLIAVVMNDSALGWVRDNRPHMQHVADLSAVDFAKVAEGFGCRSARVGDAQGLATALRDALTSTLPFVIDVATDIAVSHREIYSP